MRWALFVLAAISSAAPAVEIPRGTHVLLRVVNSVSSRTARPGDFVYFRTASPIVVDDRIAVPEHSYVQGQVSEVKRAGRVRGRAELGLRLDTLTLPHGKTLRFSPALSSVDSGGTGAQVTGENNRIEQGSQRGHDAGVILITSGSGAALGAIVEGGARGAGIGAGAGAGAGIARVLLTRGRDLMLRGGQTLDVVLDRPLLIE